MDELHRAVRISWTKGVKAALELGADANAVDPGGYGQRPLHYAAEARRLQAHREEADGVAAAFAALRERLTSGM